MTETSDLELPIRSSKYDSPSVDIWNGKIEDVWISLLELQDKFYSRFETLFLAEMSSRHDQCVTPDEADL